MKKEGDDKMDLQRDAADDFVKMFASIYNSNKVNRKPFSIEYNGNKLDVTWVVYMSGQKWMGFSLNGKEYSISIVSDIYDECCIRPAINPNDIKKIKQIMENGHIDGTFLKDIASEFSEKRMAEINQNWLNLLSGQGSRQENLNHQMPHSSNNLAIKENHKSELKLSMKDDKLLFEFGNEEHAVQFSNLLKESKVNYDSSNGGLNVAINVSKDHGLGFYTAKGGEIGVNVGSTKIAINLCKFLNNSCNLGDQVIPPSDGQNAFYIPIKLIEVTSAKENPYSHNYNQSKNDNSHSKKEESKKKDPECKLCQLI